MVHPHRRVPSRQRPPVPQLPAAARSRGADRDRDALRDAEPCGDPAGAGRDPQRSGRVPAGVGAAVALQGPDPRPDRGAPPLARLVAREDGTMSDPSAPPLVQVRELTKRFDGATAVDGVSLDILKGELFAILGGSGCGKTTLLRMLAGFEQPTSGRILIDGADMTDVPPYERPVNLMFQSYALFPHMTVEQNVAYGLKKERVPEPQVRERVAEMLSLVKLGPLAGRKPDKLSGGEKQRVALARALVKRPKLLLLDEPLAALDKKLREHTQFELSNLQYQLGTTFVVVTHDQDEAMTLASRIAVMAHGRIAQVGTPGEVYEYPVNRYVADFVGNINLIDGRVTGGANGRLSLRCESLAADLAAHSDEALAAGTNICVAVRPEKIDRKSTRLNSSH